MISFADAREATGLTQAELADMLGLTQPAVSAYEAGRRTPTGAAAAWWRATAEALKVPSRVYGRHRGRDVELPTVRWRPAVPLDATVVLPSRLGWSPRADRSRDLSDREDRASTYAQVLEEGSASDIAIWIDLDALGALWPELPIARHMVEPVTEMLAAIGT